MANPARRLSCCVRESGRCTLSMPSFTSTRRPAKFLRGMAKPMRRSHCCVRASRIYPLNTPSMPFTRRPPTFLRGMANPGRRSICFYKAPRAYLPRAEDIAWRNMQFFTPLEKIVWRHCQLLRLIRGKLHFSLSVPRWRRTTSDRLPSLKPRLYSKAKPIFLFAL